jgi:hypothetical protein
MIAHGDVEQQPAEAVVDAGDERLLVLALLVARHHVGLAGEDRRHEPWNVLGPVLQVGGIEDEHMPARLLVTRTKRIRDPTTRTVPGDAEKVVPLLQFAQHAVASIARAVIDHDDLVADGRVVREGLRRLFHEERQIVTFVLGGDEHAHVDGGRPRR